jgi:WhiB family redox-sensing transcriptional regulator
VTLIVDTPTPCATAEDPDIFFPQKGGSPRAAKALCAQCYAQERCLDRVLSFGHRVEGVWGGTTENDRRGLRSQS